ncbi:hypothetical protein [Streptomyces sp. NPDC085466]|uniref:hypothetical protein n=1 Tax=Streptomyces sp. NPDC085466 TaxID=3365725 RepID=UPI0037CEAD44
MLAFEGQPLWCETLDDFTDFILPVACPHCDAPVVIAVGDHGCYSSIRDGIWGMSTRSRSGRPTRTY